MRGNDRMIKIFGWNILNNKELNSERARVLIDLASDHPNLTEFILIKEKDKIYLLAKDYCFFDGKKGNWKKELKKDWFND